MDLAGELHQLVLHVDDLVQPRPEQIVRSRRLVLLRPHRLDSESLQSLKLPSPEKLNPDQCLTASSRVTPWRNEGSPDRNADDPIRTALLMAPVTFLTDGKPNLPVSNTSEALARFEPDVVHMELPRREIMNEARELVDTELDGVCGGGLVDINFGNIVVNPQIATQVGFAIGGSSVFGNGGSAILAQLLNQSSISSLGK